MGKSDRREFVGRIFMILPRAIEFYFCICFIIASFFFFSSSLVVADFTSFFLVEATCFALLPFAISEAAP
ncbi:hypothetical protein HH_1217 [Helicobacter hepaticus ATCC 51449]|uniref:Uncharacterized protein n=1 Tax=Helicobacter hepaticus (strain ATCC 51449 / 3B1) TaxID=235279 RepID=Q7VGV3_HELHP|nr:hypothetical protein HH_1217 [Helicobacter hepaticus ATCC 51449]